MMQKVFIKKKGKEKFYVGNMDEKQFDHWDKNIKHDPWGETTPYEIETEDITAQYEAEQTERKDKKKVIKDAMEAITDVNTKKVLKYLLRNIDNEE